MGTVIIREYRDLARPKAGGANVGSFMVKGQLVSDIANRGIVTVAVTPGTAPTDSVPLSGYTHFVELESDIDIRYAIRAKQRRWTPQPATVQHSLLRAGVPQLEAAYPRAIISCLAISNAGLAVMSVQRPNDVLAYTAGDVIGASTAAGGAILVFGSTGTNAGLGWMGQRGFVIRSTELMILDTAVITGETSYNLQLYNVSPPSNLGDNNPWDLPAGDRPSYLGNIALGTPVDVGSTLYIRQDNLAIEIQPSSNGNLFAYLQTVGAYTPTALRQYQVTLHVQSLTT